MAALLCKEIPGFYIDPGDLWTQIPVYATPQWDCCSWGGWGYLNGSPIKISVSCWDTMTACLKHGISVNVDVNGIRTYSDIEVSAKEK